MLRLLAKSLRPLPEKFHGLSDPELRYRQRYVDLIVNEDTRLVFVQRTRIIQALRNFLIGQRYLEVETPMMQPIPGGAAARPFVTHHNALDMDLYLRIAPELYLKRLVVGGFEKVFEINRSFRNEGISTRHNPEFTMLEFYVAYANYEYLMTLIGTMLREVAQAALGTPKLVYQGQEIDLAQPYQMLTIADAIKKYHPEVTDTLLNDREALIAKLKELNVTYRPGDGIGGLQFTPVREHGRAEADPADLSSSATPRRSLRSPAAATRTPGSPSASSSTSRDARSRTASRSSTIPRTRRRDSWSRRGRRKRATPRRCTSTPTTSARSSTACRPPPAPASESTAW